MAVLPLLLWTLWVLLKNESAFAWAAPAVALIAVVVALIAGRAGREGISLALGIMLLAAVAAIFLAAYPVVLPSTIDSAFDLTVENASSTAYTLKTDERCCGVWCSSSSGISSVELLGISRKRLREEHIQKLTALPRSSTNHLHNRKLSYASPTFSS